MTERNKWIPDIGFAEELQDSMEFAVKSATMFAQTEVIGVRNLVGEGELFDVV